MSEYIEDVALQTSKLDWAFPFQRTGAFPIDRSTVFSSLEDAQNYAKGLNSSNMPQDERGLGGTSYVGQVISVKNGEEIRAYIISKDRTLKEVGVTPLYEEDTKTLIFK